MNEEEQLDAMLNAAEVQARTVLLELHKPSLIPIWVILTANGKADILATPWQDENEKQRYAGMVRLLLRKRNAVAYSFLSEAWTAKVDKDEVDEKAGRLRPGIMRVRHRPNRQEAVIACACTATLARWKRWRIVREATTERIIKLEEEPFPESAKKPEGWLAEMFK